MGMAAKLLRLGEVRVSDFRAAIGSSCDGIGYVDVFVLGRPGEMSSACRVGLCRSRAGRGDHDLFRCPRCGRAKRILFTDGAGGLGCAVCARRLSRHRRDKHRQDFRRLGGREADRLHRLLHRASSASPAALRRAGGLVGEIVQADHDRLASLMASVDAALWLGEAGADG